MSDFHFDIKKHEAYSVGEFIGKNFRILSRRRSAEI